MTAPEKAAPIPADDMMDVVAGILASHAGRKYILGSDLEIAEEIVEAFVDREARPSMPDSREERIREDERDRLFAEACKPKFDGGIGVRDDPLKWMKSKGAMLPADRARARQGGNNG